MLGVAARAVLRGRREAPVPDREHQPAQARRGRDDAALGGGRRDEEKARAKERFFSHRDEFGQWERLHLDEWEQIPERDRTQASNRLIVEELLQAIEEDREVVQASSGADARAALEMIMAIHESQRLGGRVSFPLANRENDTKLLKCLQNTVFM